MAFNDEYRDKIRAIFSDQEFLASADVAKSNDDLQDLVEGRLAAENLPVQLRSAQRLPAGLNGGYRVTLLIEQQGYDETFEFGQH